jgi:lipopolysaccharide transport system ATP-binding protein
LRQNSADDIIFSSVTKKFLLGSLTDVLRNTFGFKVNCSTVEAIKNISFNVPRGELLGVLGPNGAGKSTLLRVAGGIYHPDSGKVFITSNPTAIFETGLFGNQHLKGKEFCNIYFEFRGVPKKARPALIKEIKEFTELDEYFEEPLLSYSAGMLARLLFAVVTAIPVSIVLLDEVLSVGDEYFRGKSFKRLMNMISQGASGIFVTHDWFAATRLCSKIIVLEKGEIQFEGSSQEAVREFLKPKIQTTKRVFFRHKKEILESILPYKSGEPFSFSFEIESTVNEPFGVGLALEIPKLSIVVLIDNDKLIASRKGIYQVTLGFKEFPIAHPECYLSLFLSKPRLKGQTATEEIYDQVSWTTGDSIQLMNSDMARASFNGIIKRSLAWNRVC